MAESESSDSLYWSRWGSVVEHVVATGGPDVRVIAFLHAAKTGGSSIGHAINSSSHWRFNRMRETYRSHEACYCGDPSCRDFEGSLVQFGQVGQLHEGDGYFLHFAHERYSAVRWLRGALAGRGARLESAYSTFRPARDRIVSMFCDYWKMATLLEVRNEQYRRHLTRVHERYKADSVHYLDPFGRIDGRAWFRSVADHGTGMPFLLAEMFDGSVMTFRTALEAGELELVKLHQLDDWIQAMTGSRPALRYRESRAGRSPAVLSALEESADLIDELAERDWAFDQAADEYFMMRDAGQDFVA